MGHSATAVDPGRTAAVARDPPVRRVGDRSVAAAAAARGHAPRCRRMDFGRSLRAPGHQRREPAGHPPSGANQDAKRTRRFLFSQGDDMRTANDLNLRAQRLVDVLTTGKEFVEEMLRENERLNRNVGLLEKTVQRTEAENREFAERQVEMEQQGSNLANLYVASHQLHSTLDFKEVLQIVQEIVINFIGSECFAILMADEETGEFRSIAAEGVPDLTVTAGSGQLGA